MRFCAIAIAPTIATSNSTPATSNDTTYVVKSDVPTARTLPIFFSRSSEVVSGVAASGLPLDGGVDDASR